MPDLIHGGGILGEKIQGSRRELDTFDLPTSVTSVSYDTDEVTALCPITGQPDWYDVSITLYHSKLGLESKSLKLYLQSFRDDGRFCEAFADKIAQDVLEAVKCPEVNVTVRQKPRGGISINATAEVRR